MITAVVAIFATVFQVSVLDNEPKLAIPMELHAEAEDVGDFISDVATKTGVKLKASPEVKSDRLVLYSTAPVRTTLEKIATHFDWVWVTERDGTFLLTQSESQKIEESKAREEQILMPYLRWQKEARDSLKRAAPGELDREAFKRLVERASKHPHGYVLTTMTKEENSAWLQEDREINNERVKFIRLFNPANQVADEVAVNLTKQQLLQLDHDGKLTVATPPVAFELPLAGGAVQAMQKLVNRLSSIPTDDTKISPEESAELQLLKLTPPRHPFKGDENLKGSVIVTTEGPLRPTDPSGKIPQRVELYNGNGQNLYDERISSRDYSDKSEQPPVIPQNPALEAEIHANPALQGALNNWVDSKKLFARFRLGSTKVHPAHQLAEFLVELAASGNVNYIGDCYDLPVWMNSPKLPIRALRYAMEAYAIQAKADWSFENGWISARTRYWQAQRPMNVPTETLLKIRDMLATSPVSLDNLGTAAGMISFKQFYAPLVYPMFDTTVRSRATYHALDLQYEHNFYALQFWGLLSPVARKQLLSGRSLAYGSLSPAQKESVRLFLLHFGYSHHVESEVGYSEETAIAEKETVNREWPDWDASAENGHSFADLMKNGIPANMAITMHAYGIPAYELKTRSGSWSQIATEWSMKIFGSSEYRAEYGIADFSEQQVRRTVLDRYFFTLRLGPQATVGTQLQFARPGSGSYFNYSDLPEEERARLEGRG